VGLGGDLPLRSNYGARIELEFGVLNSASETGADNGPISSASNAKIYLGGYYRYKPRITFQAGFEIHGTASDFSAGKSLTQRTFTLMPAVSYYF
jgi:hypothetical protein